MTRVVLGTAALATVGRALADSGTAAPQDRCADCQFYTAASGTPTPGAATGTCTMSGKIVSADGGCGEFAPAAEASRGASAGAGS
jgi:hypothetical protein